MPSPGKRALPVLCFAALAAWPNPAPAEEAARPLRWDELLAIVSHGPSFREGALSLEEAAGAAAAARQLPNPTVEGSLARAKEGADTGLEWGAAVSVPLDWLAKRGPAVDAADAAAEEARHVWTGRRLERLDELRELFYGLAHDQEHVAYVERLVAHARELTRLARLRVEKGEARPIEALRAETEAARAENELDRARAELEARQHRLRLLVPELGAGPHIAVADLATAPPPDLEAALAELRARAPAVRAAGARVRAAEAELSVERRERIPGLAVGGFADRELGKDLVGGTVEVELPLFSWNGGAVRRAEAALAAAEAAREVEVRESLASFAEAHRRCVRERRVAERYETEIVPRAEEALTMLERTFRVGETTLLDVIDARRVAGETRREALESRLSAKLACERVAALLAENGT